MKRIDKNNFLYLIILFLILLITVLSACDAVPPASPSINSFIASPTGITAGESATLSWNVSDATSLTINQDIGTVTGTSINVSPTTTTTYTLTASNNAGSVTESVTITVGAALGAIDIKSSPSGAKVYLDGVDTGSITPIILTNVSAGNHTVKLELYHYKTREDENVTVTAGETTYLNWELDQAPTETFTLQPGIEGKDAYVNEKFPSQKYGDKVDLLVGCDYYFRFRSYLQFDLNPNPLPPGAVITNAYLRLYQVYGIGTLNIGAYKVMSSWEENSITWKNQPTSSSEAEYSINIGSSSGTWRTWQLGDLVKGWLDGSISNSGVLLKSPDGFSVDNRADFLASEYTTDGTKRPKLEIEYYVP